MTRTPATAPSIVIAGGGEFGITAALALRARGWRVTLLEAGTFPNPLSASDDISKVVRADYGADELHTELGERAIAGWREWNQRWRETVFHEDGFLVMTREPMRPGGFEHDSFAQLTQRGHRLERLSGELIARRHPAWATAGFVDGYFNPLGGWVASGRAIARLAEDARAAGVDVCERTRVTEVIERGRVVAGLTTGRGEEFRADVVLLATGAWTPSLVPSLAGVLRPSAQTVVEYCVNEIARWQAPQFPVWAADIASTGWYGFPALPDGTLKVANHGAGRALHPDDFREALSADIERSRDFLRANLPDAADAPVLRARVCFYCDSFDGAFWVDRVAGAEGLFVAAGDSGHAFKFAPALGAIVADTVEGKPNRWSSRYAARTPSAAALESARAR